MSILIKGMEMPDNCYVCPFMFHQRRATEVWCTAIENHWLDLREVLSCDRHNDCPLVPVPPHGRLIDADAIRADIDEKRPGRSYEDAWALTIMDAAPTILEAEEGE